MPVAVPSTIERDRFNIPKHVTALVVPKKQCSQAMKLLKGCAIATFKMAVLLSKALRKPASTVIATLQYRYTFNVPKFKCLVEYPEDANSKLLLLDESLPTGTLAGLPEALQAQIEQQGFHVTSHEIKISYSHLSAAEVLKVRTCPQQTQAHLALRTIPVALTYPSRISDSAVSPMQGRVP